MVRGFSGPLEQYIAGVRYQDADSFGRDDLLHLARAAEKAFDFINSQIQADEE